METKVSAEMNGGKEEIKNALSFSQKELRN
jgi:hypothetical protein